MIKKDLVFKSIKIVDVILALFNVFMFLAMRCCWSGISKTLGYNNGKPIILYNLPVIIFDDFTTDSKYVDFPFKVKSSAMKILTAEKQLINTKFAYYIMQSIEHDHDTHKRYWISEYGKKIIGLHNVISKLSIYQLLFGR